MWAWVRIPPLTDLFFFLILPISIFYRVRSTETLSDTQSASSPDPTRLSAVIENSSSQHSSRQTSPAAPTQEAEGGVTSPERVRSPTHSDKVSSEDDSEVKLRSGASSRTSMRMSVRELAELSPEELQEVLSDTSTVRGLCEVECWELQYLE